MSVPPTRKPAVVRSPQFLVYCVHVERFRVELPTDPFEEFLVPLMTWVLDGLQEVAIAPRPATIFGRAGPLAVNAARVTDACFGLDHFFDLDQMLPGITHVVGVPEF